MSGLDIAASDGTAGPRRIWRRIFWTTGAAVVLLVAAVAFRLQQRLRLDRQITIGPETTVVEGPLAADGPIDYVGALNERMSAGVTPENNAAVPLMQAFGPDIISAPYRDEFWRRLGVLPPPPVGNYLLDAFAYFQQQHNQSDPGFLDERDAFVADLEVIQDRLWSIEEFPEHSALIDANVVPLDHIVEAVKRPRFYAPLIGSTIQSALMPVQQECRTAVRLLTARSLRRAATGDVEGAWSDLLACHRLAARVGQGGTLIEYLIAAALEAMTWEAEVALAQSGRLTTEQAVRCLADLEALAPPGDLARMIDSGERLALLDCIQLQIREFAESILVEEPDDWLTNAAIDWNVVMRLCNGRIDELVAAMRIEDFSDRTRAVHDLVAELDRLVADFSATDIRTAAILGTTADVSARTGHSISASMISAYRQSSVARTRGEARRQLARAAFALAAVHAKQGAFPATLDELAPAYIADVPLDPFTAAPLRYERTGPDEYRLYSVGDNLTDDGGRGHDSDPPGDDITIGVPSTNPPEEPGTHAE